jgi:hypothetical protein
VVFTLLLLFLLNEPVLNHGGLAGSGALLALDFNDHLFIFLQAGGKIGLLRRLGGLGQLEDGDLTDGIGLLDGDGLVRLELLEVELLDEVGCLRGESDNVS